MQWSTEECPDEWLGDNWRSEVQDSVEALKHRLQHGFMRGFMSSGFALWTRSVVISHLLQFAVKMRINSNSGASELRRFGDELCKRTWL